MKKFIMPCLAMVAGLLMYISPASAQQLNLNIPNDLCFTSQPSVDKSVSYNVTLLSTLR